MVTISMTILFSLFLHLDHGIPLPLYIIDNISVGDLVRGICHSTGIKSRLHSASEKKKSIQSPLPSVYTNEVS